MSTCGIILYLQSMRRLLHCNWDSNKPLQCRAPITIDAKADASPVTEADRQAEAAIRALIRNNFPTHAVFGEEGGIELGAESGDAQAPQYLWVIDPIDGTKSFITGRLAPS